MQNKNIIKVGQGKLTEEKEPQEKSKTQTHWFTHSLSIDFK